MAESKIEDFLGRRLLEVPISKFPGDLQAQRDAVAEFFDRLAGLSVDPEGHPLQLKRLRIEPRLADRGVAVFFEDPFFDEIEWRLYAQLVSSDLVGALPSIRFVVRVIEPVSGSEASPGIFDETRWKKLKADVTALAGQAGTD